MARTIEEQIVYKKAEVLDVLNQLEALNQLRVQKINEWRELEAQKQKAEKEQQ